MEQTIAEAGMESGGFEPLKKFLNTLKIINFLYSSSFVQFPQAFYPDFGTKVMNIERAEPAATPISISCCYNCLVVSSNFL